MKFANLRHSSGLPLPVPEEATDLELSAVDMGLNTLPVIDAGEKVLRSNRNIRKVIAHDLKIALNYEFEEINESQFEGYKTGLEHGYKFFVGFMAIIGFLRSGEQTIDEYLRIIAKDKLEMPLVTKSQRERVKSFREGRAPIDVVFEQEYGLDNSAGMARVDLGDYIFESVIFNAVFDRVEKYLRSSGHGEEEMVIEGFSKGCENALEMYIQSREQVILDAMEQDLERMP